MESTTPKNPAKGKSTAFQQLERFNLGPLSFRQVKLEVADGIKAECWELSTEMVGTLKVQYMIKEQSLLVYYLNLENGSSGKKMDSKLVKEAGLDSAMTYLAERKGKRLQASPSLVQANPWAAEVFGMPLETSLRRD